MPQGAVCIPRRRITHRADSYGRAGKARRLQPRPVERGGQELVPRRVSMNMRCRCTVGALSLAACAGLAQAQAFTEGFESGLPATWTVHNQSNPIGTTQWGAAQNATNIPPHGGTSAVY